MWFISDKIKVADSGLLERIRDCHCHLVPDVDDGERDLHESLKVLDLWQSLGETIY